MKLKLLLMILSFLREMLFGKYDLYHFFKRRKLLIIVFGTLVVTFSISIFSLKEMVHELVLSKLSMEKQVIEQQKALNEVLSNEKKSLESIDKYCSSVYAPTFTYLWKKEDDPIEDLIKAKAIPVKKLSHVQHAVHVSPPLTSKSQRPDGPIHPKRQIAYKETYTIFVE